MEKIEHGKRYGRLTVINVTDRKYHHARYVHCRCDCGNELDVRSDSLVSGNTKSCGNCVRIVRDRDHYRYICTDGQYFIFDECDLSLANSRKWHISHGYPVGMSKDGETHTRRPVKFDRLALSPETNEHVDHINGNTLDERRCNLRIVTRSQNMKNSHMRRNNKTGFKGVSINKQTGKYEVHICSDNHDRYLGLFATKEEAAKVYDEASRTLHGEYGCVNFPRPGEQSCERAVI